VSIFAAGRAAGHGDREGDMGTTDPGEGATSPLHISRRALLRAGAIAPAVLALLPLPLSAGGAQRPVRSIVFRMTLERITLDLQGRADDPALRSGDVATAGLQDRFTFLGLRLGETVAARFDLDEGGAGGGTGRAALRLALPGWPTLHAKGFRRACGACVIDGCPGYAFTLDPARGVARHETDDVVDFAHGGGRHVSWGETFHFALSGMVGTAADG
jgi:hypothetical protein